MRLGIPSAWSTDETLCCIPVWLSINAVCNAVRRILREVKGHRPSDRKAQWAFPGSN